MTVFASAIRRVILRSLTDIARISLVSAGRQKIAGDSCRRESVHLFTAGIRFTRCAADGGNDLPTGSVIDRKSSGQLYLQFKCKVCNAVVAKLISRVAYEKGVVIVRCDGCDNNHLMADNLGWFSDLKPGVKNIEDILAAKGEKVTKTGDDGCYEILSNKDMLENSSSSTGDELSKLAEITSTDTQKDGNR